MTTTASPPPAPALPPRADDPNLDPRVAYEAVASCLCGGGGTASVRDGPVWGWGVCDACGTWVNTRRPTEASLAAVYGPGYWSVTQAMAGCPPLEARFEQDMADRVPQYLSAVLPHVPANGRVAETGCGNARLLHELRARGFDAVGTEFSPDVVARVRRLTDVPILAGGVVRLAPASCDAVVSVDVLEHVHDPLAFLRAHAGVLKPGGVMVVHTPVHDTPAQPYGYSVGMLWKLYHLWLFSRGLAEELFARAGLTVVNRDVWVFGWPVYVLRKA